MNPVEVKHPPESIREEIIINWLEAIAVFFLLEIIYFLTSIIFGSSNPLLAIILLMIALIEFGMVLKKNSDLRNGLKASEKK